MKKGWSNNQAEGENAPILMKSFSSKVVRVFEGENVLEYTFDIPETATTSIDMDGALIRVIDVDTPAYAVYMSYEGARGYSPLDYLNNVVAPHVAVIDPMGTSTIGLFDWQLAETEGSEWHIASVNGGNWLIIVESKKTSHDTVIKTLESVSVK